MIKLTFEGETKGLRAWEDDPRTKVSRSTIRTRFRGGMSDEDALFMPSKKRGRRLDGFVEEIKDLAEEGWTQKEIALKYGTHASTVSDFYKQNCITSSHKDQTWWSVEFSIDDDLMPKIYRLSPEWWANRRKNELLPHRLTNPVEGAMDSLEWEMK